MSWILLLILKQLIYILDAPEEHGINITAIATTTLLTGDLHLILSSDCPNAILVNKFQ